MNKQQVAKALKRYKGKDSIIIPVRSKRHLNKY